MSRYFDFSEAAAPYKEVAENEGAGANAVHNVTAGKASGDASVSIARNQVTGGDMTGNTLGSSWNQEIYLAQKAEGPKNFRFMELPLELHREVYKYVVTNERGIFSMTNHVDTPECVRSGLFETPRIPTHSTYRRRPRNLRILRASKAIYAEAREIFYSEKFSFASVLALQTFLAQQRAETMGLLRDVSVKVHRKKWPKLLGLSGQLVQLVGLCKLQLSLEESKHRHFRPYLLATHRPMEDWPRTTDSLDVLMEIKLAFDLYRHLFSLFRKLFEEGGAGRVVEVLDVVGDTWEQPLRRGRLNMPFMFLQHMFVGERKKERKELRLKAMAEEIGLLLSQDGI